jgi:hypothetical protein
MKKIMSLLFLILFLLSSTAFAGITDPKKGSENPAAASPRENKLSGEELSRLTRRAETDNLSISNLADKESKDSNKNLVPASQIEIVHHHHRGYYYGGGVLLVILIVVLLV